MSIKVLDFQLKEPKPKPVDYGMVKRLEGLLARLKAGEVDQVLVAYLEDDEYQLAHSCAPKDGIVLSQLLHELSVKRLFVADL